MGVKDKKPRIAYMCSYVPYKLMESLGFEMVFISGVYITSTETEKSLPVNVCSYVRYCQKALNIEDFDGIILTNCCNGVQRLYDYIKTEIKGKFCHMLELHRDSSIKEYEFFYTSVCGLVSDICNFFSVENTLLVDKILLQEEKQEDKKDNIILMLGSAVGPQTVEEFSYYFKSYNILLKVCETRQSGDDLIKICDGLAENDFTIPNEETLLKADPCPRMNYFDNWFKKWIEKKHSSISGVVYISPQRCDNFLLSYPYVKKICDLFHIPIIQIQEEYGSTAMGQHSVRLEAFSESLEFKRGKKRNEK
ncbi:2-hydroxyacyl-CoA dehydratase [Wukongibacter sp. M2B1]|uniref:2-hydroxyacyl-CoA dehydratase n=1 Tax=Wukongibacter sp. M2B1 TaxID=3088895 RepID=UPI003D796C1C